MRVVLRAAFAGGIALRVGGWLRGAEPSRERSAAELMDVVMWNREPVGGPFALIDHNGSARTDADFRGKLLLVYFGFTFCSDVCPTDLQAIAAALDKLGPRPRRVQPLFITVDPEKDTPEQLKNYVALFHPRMIGLTGDPQANPTGRPRLQGLLRQDRTDEANRPRRPHRLLFLIDRDGNYLGFFPPGHPGRPYGRGHPAATRGAPHAEAIVSRRPSAAG